jgi:imidazolonepropionase-like amidohydrolase
MSAEFILRELSALDESGQFGEPLDIHVREGRIADMGKNLPLSDVLSIDCSGLWLMPGVFDCHAHPAMWCRDALETLRTPVTEWALAAADSLRRTLKGGITFLRDAGGADAGLRNALEKGYATGPRLQISIVLLSQTGGQMDGFLPGPGLELPVGYLLPDYPGRPPYRVDGVDEMRRAVREVIRAGADWVKLVAASAPHQEGQDFDRVEYTLEELQTAVFEAGRAGKPVMVDAKMPEAIEMCVRAGARSVEHGVFLDEERAALMATAGTWLVPTQYVYRDLQQKAEAGAFGPKTMAVLDNFHSRRGEVVRIARAHGVRMALGSDAFGHEMHGNNLRELLYLHEMGMPVAEVLQTATVRGAELCGVEDRYGRLAPGYVFDAIAFEEDPSDLRLFEHPDVVRMVFQGGEPRLPHPRLLDAGVPEEVPVGA